MKNYTAKQIRSLFLEYFNKLQGKSHTVVASSPLVPKNDATLLFANSGMVQFKSIFQGEEVRDYNRATTSQKCLRVSGKHNDLENVGRTARHHTFFEMLGNFSFGDYFKEDAIKFAWGFITEVLELPKDKLYVTVFEEDDEAEELWQKIAQIDKTRIFRIGAKDNFWSMGDTGPCGPCSEIFVDQGEDMKCGDSCGIGSCDCDRFLEIWNLVFMQFNQTDQGREKLPKPSIDTGMGLERIAAVCQGKRSNFDCDLFQDLIQYAAKTAHVSYSFSLPDTNDTDTALRVIADHARSAAFLVTDGILPGNEGRAYVLRRLIRRALRFATLIGSEEAFLYKVCAKVCETMGEAYPELLQSQEFISKVVREEEERFAKTLSQGLLILDDEFKNLDTEKKTILSGQFAFTLYDTYGFPLDIVDDIARKRGFSIDNEEYEKCMLEQKTRSRNAQKGKSLLSSDGKDIKQTFQKLSESVAETHFAGYDFLHIQSKITALLNKDGNAVEKLQVGEEGYLLSHQTPFYGESGGQIGDKGIIRSPEAVIEVLDTQKPFTTTFIHVIKVGSGTVFNGQEIDMTVAESSRLAIARNHTATHLLHAALRNVLGSHVQQKGSLVTAERLRFDFTHISAMTQEEIKAVEHEVNKLVLINAPITTEEMGHKEAIACGATALFGEKYGDKVRVVSIGDKDSVELCGGTHLTSAGQIGSCIIISESGIAAGIRRIEAVTGWNSLHTMQEERSIQTSVIQLLKVKPEELVSRITAMQSEIKSLKKEVEKAKLSVSLNSSSSTSTSGSAGAEKTEINGIPTVIRQVDNVPIKLLREMMDDVKSKLPNGIACLATIVEEKPQLIVYVSKSLHAKITAPQIIKEISSFIGGSGGGRPDQAQAGGTDPSGLPQALDNIKLIIEKL